MSSCHRLRGASGHGVEYEEPEKENSYDEDEGEDAAPDYAVGDVTRWASIKTVGPYYTSFAEKYPSAVIETKGDGITLGRYKEVGSAGVARITMTGWILARGNDGWTVTPVPDLIVHDVVSAGRSLGVVASWLLLGDGPVEERRDLLTFTLHDGAMEFVGQLESPVGMVVNGYAGDYEWNYRIASAGPDCLSLRAGPWSGETFGEDDSEEDIGTRVRTLYKGLAGTWRIGPDGSATWLLAEVMASELPHSLLRSLAEGPRSDPDSLLVIDSTVLGSTNSSCR